MRVYICDHETSPPGWFMIPNFGILNFSMILEFTNHSWNIFNTAN